MKKLARLLSWGAVCLGLLSSIHFPTRRTRAWAYRLKRRGDALGAMGSPL